MKMQHSTEKLNNNSYKIGFDAAALNAENLLNSAKLIAEQKTYGVAVALLILAAEEAVKAYMILSKHLFPNKELIGYNEIFEDHRFKLNTIKDIVFFGKIFEKSNLLMYGEMMDNMNERPIEELIELKEKGTANAIKWLKNIDEQMKHDLKKEIEFWKHAKTVKEDSLYVRQEKNKWHSPANTKKASYVKTKGYVEDFVGRLEIFKAVPFEDEFFKKLLTEMNKITHE